MLALAVMLLALLAPAVSRAETTWRWNALDYSLEAAFLGAAALDWTYTLEGTQHRDRYNGVTEWNPILGKTPSRARVNTMIPLAMVGHAAVAAALPHGFWRTAWQASWTYVELDAARQWWALGVALRF
jgi:hypothetical protein